MVVSVVGRRSRGIGRAAVLAFAVALSACGGQAPPTFDLNAPQTLTKARGAGRGQLVVVEPTALSVLNTDRIVIRTQGEIAYLSRAQWSDRLPRLVQSRIVEGFENGSRLRAVGTPGGEMGCRTVRWAGSDSTSTVGGPTLFMRSSKAPRRQAAEAARDEPPRPSRKKRRRRRAAGATWPQG